MASKKPSPLYKEYAKGIVSLAMLDDMMKFLVSSGTGKLGAIIAAIKLVVCVAYIWARHSLIDKSIEVEKQQSIQDYSSSDNEDVEDG